MVTEKCWAWLWEMGEGYGGWRGSEGCMCQGVRLRAQELKGRRVKGLKGSSVCGFEGEVEVEVEVEVSTFVRVTDFRL